MRNGQRKWERKKKSLVSYPRLTRPGRPSNLSLSDHLASPRIFSLFASSLFFFFFNGFHSRFSYLIFSVIDMEPPFPAIFLVFVFTIFSLSSSFALSSTIGVDSISRLLDIQDRQRAPPSVQEAAARAVLLRLLPSHSSSFEFRIVSKVFEFIWFFLLWS